ncbi:hypothetical protein OQA88_13613 [Cercophora sp. LCS_1]
MNFPAPPTFHDPLLYPQSSTPSAAPRQQQQAPSARDQPGPPPQQQAPLQPTPQQQQQQLQLLMNGGMNGGGMPGAVVSLPTPAGHQAELNYIYGMVEELSRQLAQNQRALEDVVAGVGRVRNRARTQSLGNEDIINANADEIKAQDANLDSLISLLSEALEKTKLSRDANAALLSQYAGALASMLKQFHDYKAKHVADVAAWHRSYRDQLAEARAENCRLREQIWAMQAHADKANDMFRKFRTQYDENGERWERRVDHKAYRQELRFWKRMAMPNLPDDDPYWSDDDDLIDPAEKQRQRDIARKLAEEEKEQIAGMERSMASMDAALGGATDENMPPQQVRGPFPGMMGGVPMQRGGEAPVPPPRPASAASSTGSTGQ